MIIIHGDNQIASRSYFLELKNQAKNSGHQIIELPAESLSVNTLSSALQSVSLLGGTNSIFIENFWSRRVSNEKKEASKYILGLAKAEITMWESKDQSLQLKSLSAGFVRKFDLPKYIFQFLDNPTLDLLTKSLTGASAEQIFALLIGHFHKLILVKENAGGLPSWQIEKMQTQAAKYSLSDLKSINGNFLEIDYAQKTSSAAYNLAAALEVWVMSK